MPARPFRIQVLPLGHVCPKSRPQIDSFRHRYYKRQVPVKYEASTFKRLNNVPAIDKWIEPYSSGIKSPFLGPYELKYDYLMQYGHVTVPIERTVWNDGGGDGNKWDVKSFERFEAPLSFFLEWTKQKLAQPDAFAPGESLYIAQFPIGSLPQELTADLPPPLYTYRKSDETSAKLRSKLRKTGADPRVPLPQHMNSSIWIGIPPTETPLHKDPEDNFFVQIAGFKHIRLVTPADGDLLLGYAKREVAIARGPQAYGGGMGRLDMSMRGEEMMVGPERELMSGLVWSKQTWRCRPTLLKRFDSPEVVKSYAQMEAAEATEATEIEEIRKLLKESGNNADMKPLIRIQEAFLCPGDALFIPRGWYHSVRSLGTYVQGINVSANWWFSFDGFLRKHFEVIEKRRLGEQIKNEMKAALQRR